MKALIIASLLFFGLRAMSAELGEDQKGECIYANQSASRDSKVVVDPTIDDVKKEEPKTKSK